MPNCCRCVFKFQKIWQEELRPGHACECKGLEIFTSDVIADEGDAF